MHALPGDTLVVVSSFGLPSPPEVMDARTGEWVAEYLSWPWPWERRDYRGRPILRYGDLFILGGGLVVMADRSETETKISVRDIAAEAPLWELRSTTGFAPTVLDLAAVTALDTTLTQTAPEESGRPIAVGKNWTFEDAVLSERRLVLAGRADGEPVIVSLDRRSGEIVAATRLPGHLVTLVAESGGDRLLAIVRGRHDRGHLLMLDQSTLEFRLAIANPGGWFIWPLGKSRVLSTENGSVCLLPGTIGGPPGSGPTAPRSLVVTWGATVGVHWLDTPADLTDDGRILVARERKYWWGIQFLIEEWSP